MKIVGSLLRVIIFMMVAMISSRFVEDFIANQHYSTTVIIGGVMFEIFFIYVIYRLVVE
jgi:hypothetical protein